jgi:hypothetical protein
MQKPSPARTLTWLSLYAIAMACVEAALVVYLRELYYPGDRRAIFPLMLMSNEHLAFEWVRELATLAMIASVAWLAEENFPRRFAAFAYVFGFWDIFYYMWLKAFIGWPVTLGEWDVLFLVPWPWLGPWIAPVAIAAAFVSWGAWALSLEQSPCWRASTVALFVSGAALALAAFLLPAAPLLAAAPESFRGYMPGVFRWWLFVPGWAAMALALRTTLRTPMGSR